MSTVLANHSLFSSQLRQDINVEFILACEEGNIAAVEEIISHPLYCDKVQDITGLLLAIQGGHFNIFLLLLKERWKNADSDKQWFINEFLVTACKHGRLEVVKYLLTSPEMQALCIKQPDIHYNQDSALRWACSSGHLEVVEFLLACPQLKLCIGEHANIHAHNEGPFCDACNAGHVDIVKYLLTAPQVVSNHGKIDIHIRNDYAFMIACHRKHLAVARYLWNLCAQNIDMWGIIDLHANDDACFRWAYQLGDWRGLEFLILECDIQVNAHIAKFVQADSYLKSLFEKREFKKNLYKTLLPKDVDKGRLVKL